MSPPHPTLPGGQPRRPTGTPPEVSIVIPTRNRPESLRQCLRRLGSDPTRPTMEVLVVDDDPAGSAVDVCAETDGIILLSQAGQGAANARNAGATVARGRWLVFLDDDCFPRPGWLDGLLTSCQHDHSLLVAGRMVNALPTNPFAQATQELLDFLHEVDNGSNGSVRFVASSNLAVSRDSFLRLGGFDPSYPVAGGEDRDFCARWRAAGGRIQICGNATVDHAHPMGLTGFCRQHYRYGRGAWRFHSSIHTHGSRGDRSFRAPSYYWRLLTHPLQRHPPRQACLLMGLLGVTQLMTTLGIVRESVGGRRP